MGLGGDGEVLRGTRAGEQATKTAKTRWRLVLVWLLAALSQILLGFFFPRFLPMAPWMSGAYLALIATYFLATWAAENEGS